MKDPVEQVSKGSAFIKFKTKEEAIVAVRILNGNVYISGSDKPMEVRFAENPNKPKKQHNAYEATSNPTRTNSSSFPTPPVNPMAQIQQAVYPLYRIHYTHKIATKRTIPQIYNS